jgi:quercetin dioxygenase-like cupin family protein
MKKILLILFTVCSPLIAQEAKVTTLMVKPLPDFPGKDVQMFTVEYPPGSHDPIHRHNAHGFIYVLEGSLVMAVNDGQPVTLTAGQTFTKAQRYSHHWSQREQDGTCQVPGVPAQRQRCASSDSGEVGSAATSVITTLEVNHSSPGESRTQPARL